MLLPGNFFLLVGFAVEGFLPRFGVNAFTELAWLGDSVQDCINIHTDMENGTESVRSWFRNRCDFSNEEKSARMSE